MSVQDGSPVDRQPRLVIPRHSPTSHRQPGRDDINDRLGDYGRPGDGVESGARLVPPLSERCAACPERFSGRLLRAERVDRNVVSHAYAMQ